MAIYENLTKFAGRPVKDWDPEKKGIADPEGVAYRVRLDYDAFEEGTRMPDLIEKLLEDPNAPKLRSLVIGAWDFESSNDSSEIVEALANAGKKLAALEALFLGDIIMEEQEISWIQQSDVTPLFSLPNLKVLRVRGADGLELGTVKHDQLEELAFESGGLPSEIVGAVMKAKLPRLRHLELWLGDENYGYESPLDELKPLLAGKLFPELRTLGLKDCEDQDEIAKAVAGSKLLERLEVLDLSMGTLSDEGAQALLDAPGLKKLKKLDIHYHFVSPELVKKLKKIVSEVDASDPQEGDKDGDEVHRYVAVSE